MSLWPLDAEEFYKIWLKKQKDTKATKGCTYSGTEISVFE